MSRRYKKNISHVNVNVNLMVANVTRIQSEIIINVDESAKIKNTSDVGKIIYLESFYM